MNIHPVANIFPPMAEAEYAALKADIEENGQREPIWIWREQIIDGRHREKACRELGLKTKTQEWQGAEHELPKLIVSMNLHRRHLNESQRAMIAARLATLKQGQRADLIRKSEDVDKTSSSPMTAKEAGALLHVGEDTVRSARAVLNHASAEDVSAIEQGRARVTPIAAKLPKDQKYVGKKEARRGIRKDKSAPYKPETKGQLQRAEAQKKKMVSSLSMVTGICRGILEMDVPMALSVCTKEEIKMWMGKAQEAGRAFRKFATKLEKEMKHGN